MSRSLPLVTCKRVLAQTPVKRMKNYTRRKLPWRRKRRDGGKRRRAGQRTEEADQLQESKLLLTMVNNHQSGTFEECIERNQYGKEEERTEADEKRPKMTHARRGGDLRKYGKSLY